MSDFENGDIVLTPTGRTAKVSQILGKSQHDDIVRADLFYADSGEPVILPLSLLKSHDGSLPKKGRKVRSDHWKPVRKHVSIGDHSISVLTPAEQLLMMDGCMKIQIQGQAGGLASSKKRRTLQ